ncbi:LysR substrate-binding domain-containing protein [Oleispirillum naphthae]|uniref:LysR substrate-binding domain-containing protein n=1 Tax=Oleispirillum naphthae TaxID=2838853 RepID=UPI0030826A92
MLTLRQYEYFVTLAHELHFGRAAEKLHIAQPALTHQIKAMEEYLGVRLFERTRRSVALAAAGTALLPEAEALLRQMHRTEAQGLRAGRGEIGSLEIGYVGSAAYGGILAEAIHGFRQIARDVELNFHEVDMDRQLLEVAAGRLDVGFIRLPAAELPDTVRTVTIHRETIFVALRRDHPLAARESLSLSALRGESFILTHLPPSMGFAGHIHRICAAAGFSPQVAYRASQFATIVNLAGAGLGVALVPDSVCNLHLPDVVYRPLADEVATAEIAVAYSERRLPAPVRLLVEHLRAAAGESGSILRK